MGRHANKLGTRIRTLPVGEVITVPVAKLTAVRYYANNLRKITTRGNLRKPGHRDIELGEFIIHNGAEPK